MTDKELLELAAKAAGYNVKSMLVDCDDNFKAIIIGKKNTKEKINFNPLADDGDALRLAVKLKLFVDFSSAPEIYVQYPVGNTYHPLEERETECHYAATRRAIVRAAAVIGRRM